jgi:hypothetical protein
VRSDPYDAAAVRAAFDRLRQAVGVAGTIGEEAILRALDNTPAETRSQIVPVGPPPKK